ncbi:MAG: ammonium transporter [Candidatus Marinimicrobia bacterium]|nr:ammonium transporter [Candidatus Neomarinimicrobiota bacterium]MCH7762264.1 ammonium transporter [Candidatus Neomarinimicrobiota bacterium]
MKKLKQLILLPLLFGSLYASEANDIAFQALFTVNNIWILISAFLVFIMHLGFATLESGLTQAKNTVNILFKNISIIAIGILTYALCGFNLMYPGNFNGFFGFAGLGISTPEGAAGLIEYADGTYTYFTDFIFQAMFAATAATIVSGAVAERIKISSFLIFSTVYVALIYPIVGSWTWGAGWLDARGFHDFAGSTLVHSVGGWAALVGAYTLGPRLGKYSRKGKIKPILGHNMPLATIGVMLLWFGWYGFNGGSVLSADPGAVSFVFVTTTLSAAAGVIGAMLTSWFISKKPDLSMILNGSLAGLVGITAGADCISPINSVIVGFAAGILVVFSVIQFDKMKIDDPVGAISVHLVCGIWGTLAVGIFSPDYQLGTQLTGVFAYGIFCFVSANIIFQIVKLSMGMRVTEEEEIIGLDISEHDMEAYAGFQIFTIE